jgi:hypothetical protein
MENITPPMPAKRPLAALDQPVPADVGPPKRISKKVRAAVDIMVGGDVKTIPDAARQAGLSREHLSRELSKPHISEHMPSGCRGRSMSPPPVLAPSRSTFSIAR